MSSIRGEQRIQADTDGRLICRGLDAKGNNPDGKVDIILSDTAIPVSGNPVRDAKASLELCRAVFNFARRRLRSVKNIGRKRGGVLLMRLFGHGCSVPRL